MRYPSLSPSIDAGARGGCGGSGGARYAIAVLLALGQAPSARRDPHGRPDIALDGACSLIDAIENANTDVPTHADCHAGRGPTPWCYRPDARTR